ncbi:MAG TPA: GNAT family N-acetyltransferase [Actinomycetales bacterium]|nr:GNAT family N-acetyltransferase [Actinomycetales bacterium]
MFIEWMFAWSCRVPLTWLAAKLDDAVAGAIAWTRRPDEADIDRLIVSPVMHRQGIGSALIREVLRREQGRRILVSTGRCNAPARALYESLGFVPVGDQEVLPGLWTTRYAHSS